MEIDSLFKNIYHNIQFILDIDLQSKQSKFADPDIVYTTSTNINYIKEHLPKLISTQINNIELYCEYFAILYNIVDRVKYILDHNDILELSIKYYELINFVRELDTLILNKYDFFKSISQLPEYIYTLYKKYNNFNIYYSLIKKLLKSDYNLENKLISQINTFNNLVKSDILPIKLDNKSETSSTNLILHLICTYDLTPSISYKLLDLIKFLGYDLQMDNLKENDLQNQMVELCNLISQNELIGFIILDKVYPSKIEYNIWTLMDMKYIESKNMVDEKICGINKKNIQRGETIKLLESSTTPTTPTTQNYIKIYNPSKGIASKYYLLDTLDGQRYRVLCDSSKSMLFSSDIIKSLYNTPSKFIYEYNAKISGAILSNVKPSIETIDMEFDKDGDISKQIYKKIINDIRSMNYKTYVDILSYVRFNKIDIPIQAILIEIFNSLIKLNFKKRLILKSSFLSKVETFINNFKQIFIKYLNEIQSKNISYVELDTAIINSIKFIMSGTDNIFIDIMYMKQLYENDTHK